MRWMVKVVVFGLAGAALWSLGHPLLAAIGFVVVVAANLLIIQMQKLRALDRPVRGRARRFGRAAS